MRRNVEFNTSFLVTRSQSSSISSRETPSNDAPELCKRCKDEDRLVSHLPHLKTLHPTSIEPKDNMKLKQKYGSVPQWLVYQKQNFH